MNRYIIGINTGGTYTDGVLLEYTSRKVISAAKSLTIRDDLKIGVIKVLKKLNIEKEHEIKLVGISSTLATNTVAEGKGRKVGVLLIGYDKELVEQYGLLDKIPADDIAYFSGGHNAQGNELTELDKKGVEKWVIKNSNNFDAIAVSSYFSPLNPEHEESVFNIIEQNTSLPVVMAHQLSTKLDSIKRASTASINASLVAVMQDFIQAVEESLSELKISAPLMIVRGDGTLMPSSEAIKKPVETVLSGPAASAIGGRFLAENGNGLVVDIGGTTTDMALIHNSRVVISEKGARVGDCQTAVEAAKIRSLSLGCDSRIQHNDKNELVLGPDRVRALSQIAMHHENVLNDFHNLKNTNVLNKNPSELEYWYFHGSMDEITHNALNDKQKRISDLIQKPCKLSDLFNEVGVYHVDQLGLNHLIMQGKIECAMLTPSDLLHVEGELDLWNTEVAKIALDYYCKIYGKRPKNFIEEVYNKITDVLVEEIIIFLACQNIDPEEMPVTVDGEWGKWMLQQILYSDSHFLSIDADSRYPIIGVGAPAKFFLKRAAKTVNAKFVLPDFFDVANAVGAVSGSVSEVKEAIVFTRDNKDQYTYIAKIDGVSKEFNEYSDCCEYAEETASELAKEGAVKAGATDCFVEVKRKTDGSLLRFIARAIGNPKLSKKYKIIES